MECETDGINRAPIISTSTTILSASYALANVKISALKSLDDLIKFDDDDELFGRLESFKNQLREKRMAKEAAGKSKSDEKSEQSTNDTQTKHIENGSLGHECERKKDAMPSLKQQINEGNEPPYRDQPKLDLNQKQAEQQQKYKSKSQQLLLPPPSPPQQQQQQQLQSQAQSSVQPAPPLLSLPEQQQQCDATRQHESNKSIQSDKQAAQLTADNEKSEKEKSHSAKKSKSSYRKDENRSRRSEDGKSHKSEDRKSRKSEDRKSQKSEDRKSRKSEERKSRKSEERSRSRRRSRSSEKRSKRTEDRRSRRSEERRSRRSEEKRHRRSEERRSKRRHDRSPESVHYREPYYSPQYRNRSLSPVPLRGPRTPPNTPPPNSTFDEFRGNVAGNADDSLRHMPYAPIIPPTAHYHPDLNQFPPTISANVPNYMSEYAAYMHPNRMPAQSPYNRPPPGIISSAPALMPYHGPSNEYYNYNSSHHPPANQAHPPNSFSNLIELSSPYGMSSNSSNVDCIRKQSEQPRRKPTIAVQKGNVLEIVPSADVLCDKNSVGDADKSTDKAGFIDKQHQQALQRQKQDRYKRKMERYQKRLDRNKRREFLLNELGRLSHLMIFGDDGKVIKAGEILKSLVFDGATIKLANSKELDHDEDAELEEIFVEPIIHSYDPQATVGRSILLGMDRDSAMK